MNTSIETENIDDEMSALEWIDLQQKIDSQQPKQEKFYQKAMRKTLANPVAPLGLLAACGFLGFGLKALKRGDSRTQQLMMRGRVASQAIGVISIMVTAMIISKE